MTEKEFKMKKIIIMCLCILFFTGVVYGNDNKDNFYQYHNYEWGMTKQEIHKLVKENGYEITTNYNKESKVLIYKDKLYGEKIEVSLEFTGATNKLYHINILSDDYEIGKKLKPIFMDKYGDPVNTNFKEGKWYEWVNKDNTHKVKIGYHNPLGFYIDYLSLKYKELYEKEKNIIINKN